MEKDDLLNVFKNIHELVITINSDGSIVYGHDQFAKLIKAPPELLRKKTLFDFLNRGDERKLRMMLHRDGTVRQKKKFELRTDNNIVKSVLISIHKISPTQPDLYCVVFNEISQIKLLHLPLSSIDAVTGLPNRTILENALSQAKNNYDFFAVLLVDIDHFKEVNAILGHEGGDIVLKQIATHLLNMTHEQDMVLRYDSDVFAVLLTKRQTPAAVNIFAQQILKLFDAPFIIKSRTVNITATIGVSFYPEHGKSNNSMLQSANTALLQAKQLGGKSLLVSTPRSSGEARRQIRLKTELSLAIQNKELEVVYQPKINLKTGEVKGLEALLRWHKRKGAKLSPEEFIALAEHSNLIISLEEWVLERACQDFAYWRSQGFAIKNISINLSPQHLKKKDPVVYLQQLLNKYHLEPAWLEIELTESTFIDDIDAAIAKLENLTNIGVLLSIDDFGIKYSSFSYLRYFKIQKIKLDKSFIADINKNKNSEAIIQSIIRLAHLLNFEVIAEGVETKQQVQFLQDLHCDQIQGFFVSKPLPFSKVTEFLQQRL